jgi:hypothetical protein
MLTDLVYGVGTLAAKAIASEVKTFGDGVEAFVCAMQSFVSRSGSK